MKAPRKVRFVLVVLTCGVLLLLAFNLFFPLQPSYQGRRLSDWAKDFALDDWEYTTVQGRVEAQAKEEEAAKAISHIGTNALPFALKYCRTRESTLEERLKSWINAQQKLAVQIPRDSDYHRLGLNIFKALGPIGRPAISNLIQSLGDEDQFTANTASQALIYIGSDAIPSLCVALGSENRRMRVNAAFALMGFQTTAADAAPHIVQCLNDKYPDVRAAAAYCLGSVIGETNTTISALLGVLKDSDVGVRTAGAVSLGHIRSQPDRVVPACWPAWRLKQISPASLQRWFRLCGTLARTRNLGRQS